MDPIEALRSAETAISDRDWEEAQWSVEDLLNWVEGCGYAEGLRPIDPKKVPRTIRKLSELVTAYNKLIQEHTGP